MAEIFSLLSNIGQGLSHGIGSKSSQPPSINSTCDNEKSLCGKSCKYIYNYNEDKYNICKGIDKVYNFFNKLIKNKESFETEIQNIKNINNYIDSYIKNIDSLYIKKSEKLKKDTIENIKLFLTMLKETLNKILEIYNNNNYNNKYTNTTFYRTYLNTNKYTISKILQGLSEVNKNITDTTTPNDDPGITEEMLFGDNDTLIKIKQIYSYKNGTSDYIKRSGETDYTFNQLKELCNNYNEYKKLYDKMLTENKDFTNFNLIDNVFNEKITPINQCNLNILTYEYLDTYINAFTYLDQYKNYLDKSQQSQESQESQQSQELQQSQQSQQSQQLQQLQQLQQDCNIDSKIVEIINVNDLYQKLIKKREELLNNMENFNKIANLYLSINTNNTKNQKNALINYIESNNDLKSHLRNNCNNINKQNILDRIYEFYYLKS